MWWGGLCLAQLSWKRHGVHYALQALKLENKRHQAASWLKQIRSLIYSLVCLLPNLMFPMCISLSTSPVKCSTKNYFVVKLRDSQSSWPDWRHSDFLQQKYLFHFVQPRISQVYLFTDFFFFHFVTPKNNLQARFSLNYTFLNTDLDS